MKFVKKVSNAIKNEFYNEPAYNEKYLNTKIKYYNAKININFCNCKMLKEGYHCIYFSVDSLFRKGKSDKFLEECKYAVKE